ncbi:MAG: arginine repressor [Lachnospiraceae bacterium]|nr:arginine repressor [Lachnospiraceae bacterium]
MKSARHEQIIKLIREFHIETQEELASRLNENGFSVTQATVSRDIRQLKLTKIADDRGRLHYSLPQNAQQNQAERFARVLKDSYVSMDIAGNILVIKTASGMAMAAAAVLDEWNWPEIVGCIAGDNTIMCAIRTNEDALAVRDKMSRILASM